MNPPNERTDGASSRMSEESPRKYVIRAVAEDGSTLTDEHGSRYEAESWGLDRALEEIVARDLPPGTRLSVGWFSWPDPLQSPLATGHLELRAKEELPAFFKRRVESLGLQIGDDGSLNVV